jgi:glycosyltransferase involved in cell wall biosynthesis
LGNEVHVVIPGRKTKSKKVGSIFVHEIRGFVPEGTLKALCSLVDVLRPTSLYVYDPVFVGKALPIMLSCQVVQFEEPWSSGMISPFLMKILNKNCVVDSHDVFLPLKIRHTSVRKLFETFFEKLAYNLAKLILTVSPKEKSFLVQYGIEKEKIVVIPSGVNTSDFKQSSANTSNNATNDVHKVVFLGNMEYAPNRHAIDLIASSIAPDVHKKIDNVEFIAVGRVPPELSSKYSQQMKFTGVVSHVAEILLESDVAIAPLLEGAGTRLKILEYFSNSLPVVSTSIGAEGLDVENGVNVIIEDDMKEFASKIVRLLKDKELAAELGNAARKLVAEKYDWHKIGQQLNDVYLSHFK